MPKKSAGHRVADEARQQTREIAVWEDNPEDRYSREELRAILEEAIQSLPPIFRAVFVLRDIDELSTEETARILEVSEDVVKTRLHRARLAVRQNLDGYLRAAKS